MLAPGVVYNYRTPAGGAATVGTCGKGASKNVAVCTVIPLAQVNTATGRTFTSTQPTTTSMGTYADQCDYTGVGVSGFVALLRHCWEDPAMASADYDSSKASYLAPMGTRTDVAGVGDKAFYQSEPTGALFSTTKVKLKASKGALVVTLDMTGVAPAEDAMVKQVLIGFAQTLLK